MDKCYNKLVVNTWKVQNPNRLLTEVKSRFSNFYSSKDLKWSLENYRCFVNGQVEIFCSFLVNPHDTISFFPEKRPIFQIEADRILHEDSHVYLYNKPPHVTSEELAQASNTLLVHRLDRDTTGVILLAKTPLSQKFLEQQFRKRTIYKEYLALVEGYPGEEGVIEEKMAPLHKREGAVFWGISPKGIFSKTLWRCLRHKNNYSLLQCLPVTGRTHQIRVHLRHINHPIVGDYTYGSQKKNISFRPLLHARTLKFPHPETEKILKFSTPAPIDFINPIKQS